MDTPPPAAPGWYEDPEAPDLLRWWDGAGWSDDEFQPKPERSWFEEKIESYRDLSPSSPTNYLAFSSVVQAGIEVLVATAVVVVAFRFPTLIGTLTAATFLVLLATTVLVCAAWTLFSGTVSIANARRHGNRRIAQAIWASALSLVALLLSIRVLAAIVPQWLVDAGFAGVLAVPPA